MLSKEPYLQAVKPLDSDDAADVDNPSLVMCCIHVVLVLVHCCCSEEDCSMAGQSTVGDMFHWIGISGVNIELVMYVVNIGFK